MPSIAHMIYVSICMKGGDNVTRNPNPARQAYLKQWRKNHPEKISQYNKQYWERRQKREEMFQEEANKNAGTETLSEH